MIKSASFILDQEAIKKLEQTFTNLEEFVQSSEYVDHGVPANVMSPFIECVFALFENWRTGSRAGSFPETLNEFERFVENETGPLEAPSTFPQSEAIEVLQDIERKLEGLIHIFGAPGTGFSIIETKDGRISLWDHKLSEKQPAYKKSPSFPLQAEEE